MSLWQPFNTIHSTFSGIQGSLLLGHKRGTFISQTLEEVECRKVGCARLGVMVLSRACRERGHATLSTVK